MRANLLPVLTLAFATGCNDPQPAAAPVETPIETPAKDAEAPEAEAAEGAAEAPEAEAAEVAAEAPEAEAAPAGSRVYDFPQALTAADLTAQALRDDPMQVMFLSEPVTDPQVAMQWMAANPAVYSYLSRALQEDPAVQARAIELGRVQGVKITDAVIARSAPRSDAPAALYPSDTTNGYLADVRQEQRLADTILPILEEKTVDGVRWYRLVAPQTSTREADRSGFEGLSNVGNIDFEDFSFSSDPGWVPADKTTPSVVTQRCGAGLYTFRDVSNGDMGVYVDFEGISFADFDEPNYAILDAAESGQLSSGDQIRLIWCDQSIQWLPTLSQGTNAAATP